MKKWILIITVLIVSVPGMLQADDTEIYGTITSVSLEPNVLIVFDSSGSMDTPDVPGEPYDPVTIYAGSYGTDEVYYSKRVNRTRTWVLLAPDVNALSCSGIQTTLQTLGYARGKINASSPYNCGGTRKRMRTGNYRISWSV